MARQNVFNEEGKLMGWFDLNAAEKFEEDTFFDGSNHISRATGSQWTHQELFRTKKGQWVLHTWGGYGNSSSWEFVAESVAKEWLLTQSEDQAVARFFGELEEESGPAPAPVREGAGRPRLSADGNGQEMVRARVSPEIREWIEASGGLQAVLKAAYAALASYDPALKLKEACVYAACSDDTLRRAIYSREIAVVRGEGRSSHIWIRLSELNKWIRKREKPASRVAL